MYNIPVLFLIFNRPDTTAQVFERIRQIKPTHLYVAADGAREGRPDEVKRCTEVRAIIEGIDWQCELKTLYREKNLGCKIAVSEAITWFFEQEEYGVILEDDCLPDLSFFPFCEELLIRYKDDDRIGHISGDCFFPGIFKNGLSYDFCFFAHIWGWASWRRVWKNYDIHFTYWEQAQKNKRKTKNLFRNLKEKVYFSSFISDAVSGRGMDTWDAQYLFMLRTQNQLSIYPSVNLVTNIGFNNPNATNTKKSGTKDCIPSKPVHFPLKHPEYVMDNKEIDNRIITYNFFSVRRTLRYLLHDY
ncbi:MAG: hypothetical protein LBR10_08365 [Prevotellaceae bacterium]|jgi:hypothetical protein|nr:hypothetical protein [Prevotellaceae bacterium]